MGYRRLRALFLILLVLLPASARAQNDDPPNPLASASGLRCRFVLATSAAWKDGRPAAQTKPEETQVVIANLDAQAGTADVRGSEGRGFATAMLSYGSLYIMHVDRGELNVTSVFATPSVPGRFKAAHTRQAFVYLTVPPLNEAPTVTQSYGDCEVIPSKL